jgi:hypothetical protein
VETNPIEVEESITSVPHVPVLSGNLEPEVLHLGQTWYNPSTGTASRVEAVDEFGTLGWVEHEEDSAESAVKPAEGWSPIVTPIIEELVSNLPTEVLASVVEEFSTGVPIEISDISNIHISRVDETCGYIGEVPENKEPDIYAGVEEIELTGGTLYLAVKRGSEISVTDFVTTIQVLISPSEPTPERETDIYTFSKVYSEAVAYWLAQKNSEYIDVEFEESEITAIAEPENLPSPEEIKAMLENQQKLRTKAGFKKPKMVKDEKESAQVLRTLAKKKEKNRARNKNSAKSRSKNRK